MNIVSFGGGTNSTAMLIGMWEKKIPVDLILFADTGAERPETYDYIEIMNKWLIEHDMPEITIVETMDINGDRYSLERECLERKALPSIVYGYKKCSEKHKIRPQDKYCNNFQLCKMVWVLGGKVNKYVGYDAGEEARMYNAKAHDMQDKKFNKVYALIKWGWWREDCENKIKEYGLPLPGKSSCFFCPSMKKKEIRELRKKNPELFARAVALEENAKDNLLTVKGLGRNYAWKDLIEWEESQIGICEYYEESGMPCGCYDG
jgi:hypothetical protein